MFASKAGTRLAGTATLLCVALGSISGSGLASVDETTYGKLIRSRAGKVLLVDFWATWCEPCREEMPKLMALRDRLARQKLKLELITISADEPEQEAAALQFLLHAGIQMPAWMKRARKDESFITTVDPRWTGALPALFLYDRQGRLRRSFVGETDMASVETAIRNLGAALTTNRPK